MPGLHRYPEVTRALAHDLVGWHRGRLSTVDTYAVLRRAHRVTAGWSSRAALAVLTRVPRSVDHVPRQARAATDQEALTEMRRDGVAVLPWRLPPSACASLIAFAETAPGRVRLADGSICPGTWRERPAGTAAVNLDGGFVWGRPEVQALMADERLLALAAGALGVRPVVHPPKLYWTAPAADDDPVHTPLARQFHWDFDGLGSLRVNVYLTDVDGDSGPMTYVRGSHRPGTMGWQRMGAEDQAGAEEAATRLGTARQQSIEGPAGTVFLTDPFGLHRANRPTHRPRLFLVLTFQAGGLGGFYFRPRAVPVRDPAFGAALAEDRPELRLFRSAAAGEREASLS